MWYDEGMQTTTPQDIRSRMQELYVYDLYGFRPEIKALATIVYPYETINCFATGIREGLRRLVVVTGYRVIIISRRLVGGVEVTVIPRERIISHSYEKRFFTSSIEFESEEGTFHFRNVSRRVLELFEWAMEQPIAH